jgi:hypothetical protein
LPIWNQGGGVTSFARADAQDAAARTREVRLSLRAALTAQAARVRETALRATLAGDSLLPSARQLRERATLAYQAGETGILPVLEALRSERDVGADAVDELLTYQEAVAEWNRLTGIAR